MPTRIELLKQAGFSDGEIGDWATAERQRMREAGFTDNEIDDEFGVTRPPKEIPPAFIERLKQGNWFYRILGAASEYAQNYFGDEPLGFSPKNKEALSKLGIVGDVVVPAAKPVDALLRSIPAGIAGLGAGLGQIVEEGQEAALGPSPYAKGKAARDFAQLAQIAALLSGAGGPKTGAGRAPLPDAANEPVIALPRAEDFRNAAASISGTPASFQTEQKLLRLWKEHGIPPTMVAEGALHDHSIAEAIRTDSGKLPEAYVGTGTATTAAEERVNASTATIKPTRPEDATVLQEAAAEPPQSPNVTAGEPERMIAESKDVNLYPPPQKAPRPYHLDDDGILLPEFSMTAGGRLLTDIEGRRLTAQFIAGRRYIGMPDFHLSTADIKKAIDKLGIGFAEVPDGLLPHNAAGVFFPKLDRAGPGGDIAVNTKYAPPDRELVLAHEFSHAIDHFARRMSTQLTQREVSELRLVYGTLRSGSEKSAARAQPEHFGYRSHAIKSELLAEGLRAYMADPNYFKTVAPLTAAKIRKIVNESPYLRQVIQFNSLGAAALIGIGGQDKDDQ